MNNELPKQLRLHLGHEEMHRQRPTNRSVSGQVVHGLDWTSSQDQQVIFPLIDGQTILVEDDDERLSSIRMSFKGTLAGPFIDAIEIQSCGRLSDGVKKALRIKKEITVDYGMVVHGFNKDSTMQGMEQTSPLTPFCYMHDKVANRPTLISSMAGDFTYLLEKSVIEAADFLQATELFCARIFPHAK